jgi:hypothetical protein
MHLIYDALRPPKLIREAHGFKVSTISGRKWAAYPNREERGGVLSRGQRIIAKVHSFYVST